MPLSLLLFQSPVNMEQDPLVVVPILFGLSLLAAVVLFGFFKATAVIKTKTYQAGGAIAGFIIVYLLLSTSFNKISGYEATIAADKKNIADLEGKNQKLRDFVAPKQIKGTVSPRSNYMKLLLVFQGANTDLEQDGKFQMSVRCVDPGREPLTVYVLKQGGRFVQYGIDENQKLTDLNYSVPQ
jgi:hypothetical protein